MHDLFSPNGLFIPQMLSNTLFIPQQRIVREKQGLAIVPVLTERQLRLRVQEDQGALDGS